MWMGEVMEGGVGGGGGRGEEWEGGGRKKRVGSHNIAISMWTITHAYVDTY